MDDLSKEALRMEEEALRQMKIQQTNRYGSHSQKIKTNSTNNNKANQRKSFHGLSQSHAGKCFSNLFYDFLLLCCEFA